MYVLLKSTHDQQPLYVHSVHAVHAVHHMIRYAPLLLVYHDSNILLYLFFPSCSFLSQFLPFRFLPFRFLLAYAPLHHDLVTHALVWFAYALQWRPT